MISLGTYIYIITEQCTYPAQMADQIDPGCKNTAFAQVFQQKLLYLGKNSELLRRTLMQAKILFRKEFLAIDHDRAVDLMLEALGELVALREACMNFSGSEQAAIEKPGASPSKYMSQTVPSAGNVQTQCKTFAQKADHFTVKLMEVVRLFYLEQKGKNWDDIQAMARDHYGYTDLFCEVLSIAVSVLKLVLNTRDCLEHHLPGAVIRDFKPESDGRIAAPTIEVNFGVAHLSAPAFPLSCRVSSSNCRTRSRD
jgi:hypothetical protein